MKRNTLWILLAITATTLFMSCNSCSSSALHKTTDVPTLITTDGIQLIKNGEPYHFVGCNVDGAARPHMATNYRHLTHHND